MKRKHHPHQSKAFDTVLGGPCISRPDPKWFPLPVAPPLELLSGEWDEDEGALDDEMEEAEA